MFLLTDNFFKIHDQTFVEEKMTLKTKKIDKIVLGLQQGLENHQGRSSIFMKKLF